jgi:L-asparaginase II
VTSTADLALLFSVLATEDELADQREVMGSHPVLIGDVGRPDGVLSAAGFPAKHGAEGCIGVAVPGLGLGIAIKVWDGSPRPEGVAAAAALDHLGLLDDELAGALATPVLGGGKPVGGIRSVLVLS